MEEWTRLEEQRVCERFTLTLKRDGFGCMGACYNRIHLTSDGLGYLARAESPERPEAKFLFVATPEELDAVKGALEEALTQKWEDEYECSYCTVRGRGARLLYTCDGTQFLETTTDLRSGPLFLRQVLARLLDLQWVHSP